MHKISRLVVLAALSLLTSCGDSTGPAGEPLTGTWLYSVPDITLGLQRCSITDLVLTLQQTGDRFTGSTSGGTSTCSSGQPQPIASFPVTEGSIRGNLVTFNIAGTEVRNEGTLSGNTVTGTAMFSDEFGQAALSAEFVMTRR